MGLFDGGLFDFNGDGKSSFGEEFLGFMIFNEILNEKSDEPDEDEDEVEIEDEDEDEY